MIVVKLTQGKVAHVSEVDYPRVAAQRWYARRSQYTWYATGRNGLLLHRYILRAPKALFVDHIDGNGLNNVRENLRLATPHENSANKRLRYPLGGHGFRGVYPTKGGWRASLSFKGARINGGVFDTPEAAAKDYDRIMLMLYGDYAATNEKLGLFRMKTHEEVLQHCLRTRVD